MEPDSNAPQGTTLRKSNEQGLSQEGFSAASVPFNGRASGLTMELAVGLMLVLLGALNLSDVLKRGVSIEERHGARRDVLVPMAPTWITGRRRPLIVGVFHGLAGSAAIALLVLATIPSPMWAMTYLAIFGTGTLIGMSGITACIAAPVLAFGGTGSRAKALINGSGIIGLGFGL